MKDINIQKFLNKLKEETKFSGLNQCPVEIIDLGKDVGLTEEISLEIADYVVKSGIADYKAIGSTMIQLR